MTIIENITFPCSEEFKADPAAATKDLRDLAAKAPGFLKFYYGFRVSDPSYGHIFIAWNTMKDQETFHASHQMSIIQAIGHIVSKRDRHFALTRRNIDVGEASYEAVLEAPVTLFQNSGTNPTVTGSRAMFSGPILEENNTPVTMTGWDTEDSARETSSSTESFLVKLTPYHA